MRFFIGVLLFYLDTGYFETARTEPVDDNCEQSATKPINDNCQKEPTETIDDNEIATVIYLANGAKNGTNFSSTTSEDVSVKKQIPILEGTNPDYSIW